MTRAAVVLVWLAVFAPTSEAKAQTPRRIAVAPLVGAPAALTDQLITAVTAVDGLDVVDLREVRKAFGERAFDAALACAREPCPSHRSDGPLGWEELIIGELRPGSGALRLALLRPGPEGPSVRVRVASTFSEGEVEAALQAGVAELFPIRVARSGSAVKVINLPEGAALKLDNEAPVEVQGARAQRRLSPGAHRVEVRAPGHEPWSEDFVVRLGEPVRLEASLSKRRSLGPWILGGAGLLAAGAGAALAVSAQLRADDWVEGCPSGGSCAPGFTRERFLSDEDAISVENGAAAVLLAAGAASAVSAVVWFILDPGRSGPDDRFAVSPTPRGFEVRF